jgi:hypothetical protein
MPINDGRPEPSGWQYNRDGLYEPIRTMTLRQCYAGMAMQGLCAKFGVVLPYGSRNCGIHDRDTAYQAVRYADALITELEKGA